VREESSAYGVDSDPDSDFDPEERNPNNMKCVAQIKVQGRGIFSHTLEFELFAALPLLGYLGQPASSYPEIQKFSDLEMTGFQFGNEIFSV